MCMIFVWAADPEFKHVTKKIRSDLTLHLLYKTTNEKEEKWLNILTTAEKALPYIEQTYGPYPYKQYSFIHGGDGGMEYPMATLLAGPGLGGVFHEWMHSWYQGMLGTNESMYAWMDEGFTSWATDLVEDYYYEAKLRKDPDNSGLKQLLDKRHESLPLYHADPYDNYFSLVRSRLEEQ